jgi:hypothetical protein
MVRERAESAEERRARELSEAYGDQYEEATESELKTRIVDLLDEIDDTTEQRKAHMDTMKDLIDNKKDELQYCRERRQYVQSAQGITELEAQATNLLQD